jgi:hypothetical protein
MFQALLGQDALALHDDMDAVAAYTFGCLCVVTGGSVPP